MSRRIKKRKLEVEEQKINDGEQDNFFPDKAREEMETMWEIPQIYHFLHLTKESLNIPQLSMYEMERMLLIPRASKQLANVMTCLLSSPITKAKLHKVPSMPYEFWTNILTHKMVCWFKVYHSKHKDPIKVLDSIGVEPEFWSLFPDESSLDGKDFEDLNFKQRVWLLKTVCDTIMHTRKAVQEEIAKQPWLYQFETVLGFDRYGARYIYFPQFLPNDFRIYRQCLDNKILSTVEPVKSERESEKAKSFESNIITARINRYRRGKSRYYNDSSDRKSKRREDESNEDRKDLNSFKCGNDSAVNSFISEDANLSGTSTRGNAGKEAKRKRCGRSLSKTSDESTSSNARSSGYDTTASSEKSVFDESSQMFKGFANTETNNCRIGIIKEMLNDLKSEIDEEKKASERESNSDSESESKDNSTILSCKSTTDSCNGTLICERDETKSFWDNLSSSLKTDDEKLKEIINSSGGSKLPENMYLKSLSAGDDFSDSSTVTCKSDDEKLSETKNSDSTLSAIETNDRKVTFIRSFCASSGSSESLNKDVTGRERFASKTKISQSRIMETELNDSEETETVPRRNLRKRTRLRSHYRRVQSEINADKKESKTADATKDEGKTLRDETDIKGDTEDSDDSTNNSDIRCNLRNSNDPKTGECREHFNELLSDLGVSDFHLVADSADGLRDLISVFKTCNSETDNADGTKDTRETKLMEKLTELLNNVESVETIVRDATRKARAKLQREWFNFKEGIAEDQDSSNEGGLSSNWWVLGSQGRDPLSTAGDATLQTLPRSALSTSGAQNAQPPSAENKDENTVENDDERSRRDSRGANDERRNSGNSEKQTGVEAPSGRNQPVEEQEEKQTHEQNEKTKAASVDEDTEQQTRRVLRARGVPSYTEQLYSDYETDEDELEEWTDVEAVYAAPGAQADTSAARATSKVRHADDWSEREDSDQDWILPGTRKRKNKRPSANRRLKSFQHKMQTIKENSTRANAPSDRIVFPDNLKICKDKLGVKLKNPDAVVPSSTKTNVHSGGKKALPPSNPICKIDSVHSELDIKEDPIYESAAETTNYGQNCCDSVNPQQNYYYVIPHNPGIPGEPRNAPLVRTSTFVQGMSPQVPAQAYYVLPGAQPNYVMQNSPANLLPATEQQQQPVFQQHQSVYQQQSCSPMMVTQSYINNVNCVSYGGHVVAAVQPLPNAPRPPMTNPQNPVVASKSRNRLIAPQPQPSYPNYPRGAVIRSSNPPVRGACHRPANPRGFVARGATPRSRMSNPRSIQAAPRQRTSRTSNTEKTSGRKTTSLIVLSDDDDEIEMIITEKTSETASSAEKSTLRKTVDQTRQKPRITSDITLASSKSIIPPQIIQRMSQGGISITPIKNTPPPQANTNTQLVVVVNETGSHYALALPNGSKLILTPEQVAQIRASNGGKLIL